MTKSESIDEYMERVKPMLSPMDEEETQAFREMASDVINRMPDSLWDKIAVYYPMIGNTETKFVPIENKK